jgi:hypothetical protein
MSAKKTTICAIVYRPSPRRGLSGRMQGRNRSCAKVTDRLTQGRGSFGPPQRAPPGGLSPCVWRPDRHQQGATRVQCEEQPTCRLKQITIAKYFIWKLSSLGSLGCVWFCFWILLLLLAEAKPKGSSFYVATLKKQLFYSTNLEAAWTLFCCLSKFIILINRHNKLKLKQN